MTVTDRQGRGPGREGVQEEDTVQATMDEWVEPEMWRPDGSTAGECADTEQSGWRWWDMLRGSW